MIMMIDDKSLAEMQNEDKCKEFCKYFNELDKKGISYSVGDMYRYANNAGISPPSPEELLNWLGTRPRA